MGEPGPESKKWNVSPVRGLGNPLGQALMARLVPSDDQSRVADPRVLGRVAENLGKVGPVSP